MTTNRGAYLMARITSHGLQVDTIFGGRPELEKMDIAAACTGLESLDYHLIMAKYCDDVRSALDAAGELDCRMAQTSETLANLEPQQRSAMALFMVQDFVSPKKCRWCKGRKEVKNGGRFVAFITRGGQADDDEQGRVFDGTNYQSRTTGRYDLWW